MSSSTADSSPLLAELRAQEASWQRNDLLRELYRDWMRTLAMHRSQVAGATVELGSGIGRLREFVPDLVTTDIEASPWSELVVDAQQLPWGDGALANIFLLDVLHHIPRPLTFLDEAVRCLAPGGRVILLEPYCSPVSTPLYKAFHRERTDLSADPFTDDDQSTLEALDSNQALPTLLFFRRRREFAQRWPLLAITESRRLSTIAYPLSGGWHSRPLLPARLLRPTLACEHLLRSIAPLSAFRCLVVLERLEEPARAGRSAS